MDDVKRKVLLDLFVSPSTLLPLAGGLSMLMGSWAMGGSALLNFAGVAGILGGVGMFATRLIFGLERITNKAYEFVIEKQQEQQEQALDRLDAQLTGDRDSRTEACLRQLRELYVSLKADARAGRVTASSRDVLDGIDRLFRLCVENLQESHELWEKSQRVRGYARKQALVQREELVEEVAATVVHLAKTIDRLHSLGGKQKKSELAEMRRELDESLQAARRAEERVAELSGEAKPYDVSEFESE